jgi:hypothetical protein
LEGLAIEDVDIFGGHLVYFTGIGNILSTFGIFSPFWYAVQRKIWQPLSGTYMQIDQIGLFL